MAVHYGSARFGVSACQVNPERGWFTLDLICRYFLDNIDVNKYGSNYTLLSGSDGAIIVNSSSSVIDFHVQYNLSVHQSCKYTALSVRLKNEGKRRYVKTKYL